MPGDNKHFRMWEESSLLNTRVDNLQLGALLSSAVLNAKQLQDLHLTSCSCHFFCSCFVTVCAAAVCVGTIEAVLSLVYQLVIQTVCQSTRGNTVSLLAL